MSTIFYLLEKLHKISPIEKIYAHCDIPCGIYDPHDAQVSAHTVIRMIDLIKDLKAPTTDSTAHEIEEYNNKLNRCILEKEKHAEWCKHQIRILWGDYFKDDHVKNFPELHDLVWKVMQSGSKAKQSVDRGVAEELLCNVQRIAEIFWETKGVGSIKIKSFYPTGSDMVYPKTS